MEDDQSSEDDCLLEMEKRIVDKLYAQLVEAVAKAWDGTSRSEVEGEGFF